MQIRIRNHKTEFLRSFWDKDAKRTRQKLIKEDEFTDEEKAEYAAYRAKLQAESAERHLDVSAMLAVRHITDLAQAVEQQRKIDEPAALLAALDRLNLALRKAGIKRPPRTKAA